MDDDAGSIVSLLRLLVKDPWSCAPPIDFSPSLGADVLGRACRLGLGPLVAKRLLDRGGLDPKTRELAYQVRAASAVRHRASKAHLAAALRALGEASIAAVALKGPVFAELAYEDPTVRASIDLDVLVPRERLRDVLRALAPLGYRPRRRPLRSELDVSGDLELDAPDARPSLDLHFSLAKPMVVRRAPLPEADELIVREDGVTTLGPAWTLAFAAVQAHQDLLALRRIVDLAACLARTAPAAVPRALEVARAFGVAGTLRVAFALAREIGAPRCPALEGAPPTALQCGLRRWLGVERLARSPSRLHEDEGLAWHYAARFLLLDRPREALERAFRLVFAHPSYVARRGGSLARLRRLGMRLIAEALPERARPG